MTDVLNDQELGRKSFLVRGDGEQKPGIARLLTEKEVSRKSFLKGGGALVVGLTAVGSASALNTPKAPNPAHTGGLPGPPSTAQIDTWLQIHPNNTATLYAGWVELGQGTPTAAVMIAAEELDMSVSQIKYTAPDTNVSVSSSTVGSGGTNSALGTGTSSLRGAAAAARKLLLEMASAQLGAPVSSLSVENGVVSAGGRSVKYGDLMGDKLFNATIASASATTKTAANFKVIGTKVPQIHIPEIASGKAVFAHNVRVPGMLHGRIVRPHGQAALSKGAKYTGIDETSIKHIKGVQIVKHADFLGVVAPSEYDAIQAAAQLKVTWDNTPSLAGSGNLNAAMRNKDNLLSEAATTSTGNATTALAGAAKKTDVMSFFVPYQGHVPMGPNAAVAVVGKNSAQVFSASQAPYGTRTLVFNALRQVDPANFPAGQATNVRIMVYPGAGTYGHSSYDEAAVAASVMSYKVGAPVRVQLMRWDEHGWGFFGPAHSIDIQAGIDATGKIAGYEATAYLHGWTGGTETSSELVGIPLATNPATQNANATQLGGYYEIGDRRLISKRVHGYKGFLKGTYLRAPQEPQTAFASESTIDELARLANMDPIAFRKLNFPSNATGARWNNVLDALATAAKWEPKVPGSAVKSGNVVTGRGVALGGFAGALPAHVVDVTVNKTTGKIIVDHVYTAQDNGLAANPVGVESQIVGCVVQGCSRALHEEMKYSKVRVTGTDWVSYPILRFKDAPKVTVIHLQRTDLAPNGSGEPATVAIPAAIANAFFDATGVRLTRIPFTPGYVRGMLKKAGQ